MCHILMKEQICFLICTDKIHKFTDGRVRCCCSLRVYEECLAFTLACRLVCDKIEVVSNDPHLSRASFQTFLAIVPVVGQDSIVRGSTTIPRAVDNKRSLIGLACVVV